MKVQGQKRCSCVVSINCVLYAQESRQLLLLTQCVPLHSIIISTVDCACIQTFVHSVCDYVVLFCDSQFHGPSQDCPAETLL